MTTANNAYYAACDKVREIGDQIEQLVEEMRSPMQLATKAVKTARAERLADLKEQLGTAKARAEHLRVAR